MKKTKGHRFDKAAAKAIADHRLKTNSEYRDEAMRPQLHRQMRPASSWPDGSAMLRKKAISKLIEQLPACTVCGAVIGPGGRRAAPAKCARCYQRTRRGLPDAPRLTALALDASITVQLPSELKAELQRAADALDESVSTFVLHLVQKAVRR